ncbi:MAG: hypothetical protein PVG14_10400 [Anaerolineales bacterium]|jgi:hypothetical protein
MKLSLVFTLNAIAALVFGLAFLLIPVTLAELYGGELSDAGVYVARLLGAVVIGYCLISWLTRNAGESDARRAIVIAFFISWAIGLVVTLLTQFSGLLNALGWLNVVIYAFFTFGYGYNLFAEG